MQLIKFYVLRGHDIDKLVNLTAVERIVMTEFMNQYYEEEEKKYKAMFGGK